MRRTVLVVVFTFLGPVLAACGDSAGTGSGVRTNAVCFTMADDWSEASQFQQNFFVAGEMLPGVHGVEMHLSPNYLQVSLSPDVDADRWVAELPAQVRTDPAVKATEIGACAK